MELLLGYKNKVQGMNQATKSQIVELIAACDGPSSKWAMLQERGRERPQQMVQLFPDQQQGPMKLDDFIAPTSI